jgi:urease accessory protein
MDVMERDAREVRDGPFEFTNCKTGEGIDAVVEHIERQLLFA